MRIIRLALERYGHLSDIELTFPAERGLHVVLGPNEAGKSTALAAISDCLFAFPHRTPFAFLHNARDLRVGITLHAADGREGTFVRRKGRKDDLCDPDERPLPEGAIAAFLGGATRERFDRVFGLDAAELRRGGLAILKGEGDVGESLLQAHTGLHGFRALVDRLGEEASQLFGDRRGKRELHTAVEAFKAAKRELDERSVEPADYKQKRDDQAWMERARAANACEAEALQAERARLDRIRRTAPARSAVVRALADLEATGVVPALPADADEQRSAAMLARERARHDLDRERDRDARLRERLAALVVDDTLLDEGDAIDALAADQNLVAGARKEREAQLIAAEQHRRAMEQVARRLGLPMEAGSLAARIPDALTRDAASRAITAHVRLSERQAKAREGLDAAREQCAAGAAALAALAEPVSSAELRCAIDAAKAEGRIDAERTSDAEALDTAQAELERSLAALLPLWTGTADALAAAPVPLEAMIARHAEAYTETGAALRAREAEVATHDKALGEIAAELRGITEAGDLPTGDAIVAARDRRDRAWRLIRRQRIDGGAAPSRDELDGLGQHLALPDAFDALLREADALADRRANDAARVATFEQLRRREVQARALRTGAAAAVAPATAAHTVAAEGWTALWRPADLMPHDPASMREWMRRRSEALTLRQRRDEAEHKLAATETRHRAAWSGLVALLPTEAIAAGNGSGGNVAALLSTAERVCAERERQESARAKAQVQADGAQETADRAVRVLAVAEADLAALRGNWTVIVAALGLSVNVPVEDGRLALDLWSEIETEAHAWQTAQDRVAQLTRTVGAFAEMAAQVAGRVAPDLAAGAEMHHAVRALSVRLAATRAAAGERREMTAERDRLRRSMEGHERASGDAESTLAALRALAGAADDAALQTALARSAERTALSRQIAEREAELSSLGDGRSLAALEREAAGVNLDLLPMRLAEIEERLRHIADENATCAGTLTALRAALQGMAGEHTAAAAAQAMHDALAEVDDVAARYVRLRLAHTLLRAGIDRFRRQQQAPLLGRAGQLFSSLTEGRYDRLGVDEAESGKLVLVALRPDGTECPAERLSEGTRDQLYLALRLAAIEGFVTGNEPLPFIADDLLVNFDDRRARAALRVLGEFGMRTQVILFTHHAHIAAMADQDVAALHHLPTAARFLATT